LGLVELLQLASFMMIVSESVMCRTQAR